jgi:hypothetical protein
MRTNTIYFSSGEPSVEVLRLSKDGIWSNPDIPADDAAKFVLEAIDYNIKVLVQKAVEDEREACANLRKEVALLGKRSTEYEDGFWDGLEKYEELIRARGKHDTR